MKNLRKINNTPRYIGFLTYLYVPVATNFFGASKWINVPCPIMANSKKQIAVSTIPKTNIGMPKTIVHLGNVILNHVSKVIARIAKNRHKKYTKVA